MPRRRGTAGCRPPSAAWRADRTPDCSDRDRLPARLPTVTSTAQVAWRMPSVECGGHAAALPLSFGPGYGEPDRRIGPLCPARVNLLHLIERLTLDELHRDHRVARGAQDAEHVRRPAH